MVCHGVLAVVGENRTARATGATNSRMGGTSSSYIHEICCITLFSLFDMNSLAGIVSPVWGALCPSLMHS